MDTQKICLMAESNMTDTQLMEKILYQKNAGQALQTDVNVLENLQVYKSKPEELLMSNPNGLFFTQEASDKSLNDGSYWRKNRGPKSRVYSSGKPDREIAESSSFRFINSNNLITCWVIEEFTCVVQTQIWRLAKLIRRPVGKRKTSPSNVSKSRMSAAPMNEGLEDLQLAKENQGQEGEVHGHGQGVTNPTFSSDGIDEGLAVSSSLHLGPQPQVFGDYDRDINHDGEGFGALSKMVVGFGALSKMVQGSVLHGSPEINWPFDDASANWESPVIPINSLDVTNYLVDNVAEACQVAVRGGGSVGEESSKKLKLYSNGRKLKLYSDGRSFSSCRVVICLNLKGIEYEYNPVSLDKGDQCSPDFLNLNPLGYVPVLVDGDMVIKDSFAILMYLDDKSPQHPLLPKDVQKKTINYEAVNICSRIQAYIHILELMRVKLGTGADITWAQYHIKRGFDALEKLLKDCAGKYATGDEVFLADLFLAPQINAAIFRFQVNMGDFPVLMRIFGSYVQLPAFQFAIGQDRACYC